eukprot:UN28042
MGQYNLIKYMADFSKLCFRLVFSNPPRLDSNKVCCMSHKHVFLNTVYTDFPGSDFSEFFNRSRSVATDSLDRL